MPEYKGFCQYIHNNACFKFHRNKPAGQQASKIKQEIYNNQLMLVLPGGGTSGSLTYHTNITTSGVFHLPFNRWQFGFSMEIGMKAQRVCLFKPH